MKTRHLVLERGIEKIRMGGTLPARAMDDVELSQSNNAAEDQTRRAEAQSKAEEVLLIDQGRL